MTEGQSGDEVVVECELDATPEKIWRALTIPELASAWLDPSNGDAPAVYTIVEAEPYTRLRYAWSAGEIQDHAVTVELSPGPDGGTWFRLTHRAAEAGSTRQLAANGNNPPLLCAA